MKKEISEMQGTVNLSKATNPRISVVTGPSYHGNISGREAEKRLHESTGHCHLTRYSLKRDCYVLSVQFTKGVINDTKHFKIVDDKTTSLETDGNKVEFDSFEYLLNHYKNHPLTPEANSTIGRPCQPCQTQKQCCVVL